MTTRPTTLPDLGTLSTGLSSVFSETGFGKRGVTILDRKPNIYSSTSPSEIVNCRLADGSEVRLLCKYAAAHNGSSFGHRGGGPYEAAVYQSVLGPLKASAPRLFGTYVEPSTAGTWLILEYVEGFSRGMSRRAFGLTAQWIAKFHAAAAERLREAPAPPLARYDAAYFQGWAQRTAQFAGPLHARFPWLAVLCERFMEQAPPLLTARPTIIHGEFYPHNVLSRRGEIYPVDWESTAIGAGEIDLASLTEGWPRTYIRECEVTYKRARWPQRPPADFKKAVSAARLYLAFRWLGESRRQTQLKGSLSYFDQLRVNGGHLGLLQPDELGLEAS